MKLMLILALANAIVKVLEIGAKLITPNNPKDDIAIAKVKKVVDRVNDIFSSGSA